MSARLDRVNPFKTPDARRLAMLFAVVYFSQGMYHVADQVLTPTLKERLGLSPSQVGKFGTIILVPWVVKPLYGMITDAMMVENGKPLGLTGAFQSVQWAAINMATLLVGLIGGYFAERRELQTAFLIAAAFPFLALMMGAVFIHEAPAKSQREEFQEAWRGIKTAVRDRTMWVVAGFIFFWTFSPSIGIPLFYYQTDTLKFSQQFIGLLG